MPLSPGSRLGPYEVVAPIGAGGMGEVFRARDTRLDRNVAIKILPAEFAQNAQLKLRFEREARTISQLSHPNICTLYDVGDGYLVMELLDGETLADRISKGPLPIDQVLKISAQIADALDRAHQAGIIHRDLKPSNVMLTKSGAKLLDFGLARNQASGLGARSSAHDETQHKPLTEEGTVLGTYQYMAPEQLAGEEADARTDIFALGTVMYEMATGRRAFDGKTKTSIITAIVSREPSPISQVQPFTPPTFDHVVRKCLTKDPDDRWQSARDIASELRWIIDSGSSAGVAAPIAMRRKSRERVLWLLALIAVAAASLLIARRMRLGEVQRSYRFTVPMIEAGYKAGSQVRISPDGQTLYFRATDGRHNRVFRRRLDEFTATPIEGAEDLGSFLPTPDGRSLLLSFPGAVIKRVSVNGGPLETVADGAPGNGAVSKDGTIILGGDTRPLSLLRPDHTQVEITKLDTARGETGHTMPWFLPDGKSFLFLAVSRNAERGTIQHVLCGARLGSKEVTHIAEVSSRVEYALGHIFFVRGGTLVAQPFDVSTFKLTGDAVPVADNVLFGARTATAAFSVAENGTVVYQPFAASNHLVIVDGEGKTVSTVMNSGGGSYSGRFVLLPDGSRVIVQVTDTRAGLTSLWVYGLMRQTATRLTFSPEIESTPVVTPDGKNVFFSSDAQSTFDIFEAPIDGSQPPALRVGAPNVQFASDVSRDGRYLVYSSNQNQVATKQDLWVLPLTGEGKPQPFLATPAVETEGAFSADGKWVAYTSDATGIFQIYVRPFPGPGEARPVSTKGGRQAKFSVDGKHLYWVDDNALMSAEFHADGSTSEPVVVFELRDQILSYQPMPAGRFMLMLQNELDASPAARVIVGWQPPANQ